MVEGLALEGTDCTCTAGTLHAGTAANVIPSHASVTGTLRTFTPAQTDTALARLEAVVAELGEETGCTVELSVPGWTPAVVNDGRVTDLVRGAATAVVGADSVVAMPPVSPSDDVSESLQRIPGTYFFVGARRADGTSGMHHNPGFAIDEGCLPVAAAVLATSAVAAAGADPRGD